MGTDGGDADATLASQGVDGPRAGAAAPLQPGERMGRFEVEACLGRGGHGAVYRGRDSSLGRTVAIKLLHPGDADRDRVRLVREARALAQLEHPNVVRVFDVGEHRGQAFVAMEFLDGVELGRAWRQDHWPRRRRLQALLSVGRGLAAAHRQGLVHRDVKPANILACRDGRVVLVDFGLVRELVATGATPRVDDASLRTNPRAAVGTRGYMAPEQRIGVAVDTRADQFGFAASIYEAVHDRPPFGADDGAEFDVIAMRRIARQRRGRRVPRWLIALLARGLDPDPAHRFASMDAMVAVLEAGLARRRRLAIAATGALSVAALGVAMIATGPRPRGATLEPELSRAAIATVDGAASARSAWQGRRADDAIARVREELADRTASQRVDALGHRIAALPPHEVAIRRSLVAEQANARALVGDELGAEAQLRELIDEAQRDGDDRHVAVAELLLGQRLALNDRSQSDGALRHAEVAGVRAAALPPWFDAELAYTRALAAFAALDYDGTETQLWLALELSPDDGPFAARMRAKLYNGMGALSGARGDFDRAVEWLQLALDESDRDLATRSEFYANLGGALLLQQRWQAGLAAMRASLDAAVAATGPDSRPVAVASYALAFALADDRQWRECIEHAQRSVTVARALHFGVLEVDALTVAARCERARGRLDAAAGLADRAIVLGGGSGELARGRSAAWHERGLVARAAGDESRAMSSFAMALVDARDAFSARRAAQALLLLPP